MSTLFSIIRNTTLSVAAAGLITLSAESFIDYQFNDANGTQVKNTDGAVDGATAGGQGGTWNFSMAKVQNGHLNYGYTNSFKYTGVDSGTGTTNYRTYSLTNAITAANYSTYTLEVSIPKYDIRQNWDPNNTSAAAKGIYFGLQETTTGEKDEAIIGFQTTGTNGTQAYASTNGTGDISGAFSTVSGAGFDGGAADGHPATPVRFANSTANNPGILLRITGDLSTGAFTASAQDTNNQAWVDILTGSGLTQISSFRIAAKTPSVGSWGAAGAGETTDPTVSGTPGDYFNLDYVTLDATAIPEPGTFALIAGFLAFSFVAIRRRKA